jgi:hypothetical protein
MKLGSFLNCFLQMNPDHFSMFNILIKILNKQNMSYGIKLKMFVNTKIGQIK